MRDTTPDWQKDSDRIFTAITTGDFANYQEAQRALVQLYVPDLSISRGGISHVMTRLQKHYANKPAHS